MQLLDAHTQGTWRRVAPCLPKGGAFPPSPGSSYTTEGGFPTDSPPPNATLNCPPPLQWRDGMFLKPCILPGLFLIPDSTFPPEPSPAFHPPEHRVTLPATLPLPHPPPALPSLWPPSFSPRPLLLPSSLHVRPRGLFSARSSAPGHCPAPLLCSGPARKLLTVI